MRQCMSTYLMPNVLHIFQMCAMRIFHECMDMRANKNKR